MRGGDGRLLPFADRLLALQDTRRDLVAVDPHSAARTLATVTKQVDSLRALFEPPAGAGRRGGVMQAGDTARRAPRRRKCHETVANRAADNLDQIRGIVGSWYRYYDGYDPHVHVVDEGSVRASSTTRSRAMRARCASASSDSGRRSSGRARPPAAARRRWRRRAWRRRRREQRRSDHRRPDRREGLKADLAHEMIPYTPEELIAIAEREYAFSLSEMKKASREMGFGDDWKAAMEKVKNTYVEPGKQPDLIRDLARQAEAFFDAARLGDDPAAGARGLADGDDERPSASSVSPVLPRRRVRFSCRIRRRTCRTRTS